MKILNHSIKKTKKTLPLFFTMKPLKLTDNNIEKADFVKDELEIIRNKAKISVARNPKIDNIVKSYTTTENSVKSIHEIRDCNEKPRKTMIKKFKFLKKRNFIQKEGHFNSGRWQQDEHERFIEAILKFGNEWKKVQKYVKTRSSSQARSHAQKFLFKVNKSNILELDDNNKLNKNSLKSLHDLQNKLEEEKFAHAVKVLNLIGFEKASNSRIKLSNRKIKIPKDEFNLPNTKNPFSHSNSEIDDNFLYFDENLSENFYQDDFDSQFVQDKLTETLIQNYCLSSKKSDVIMKRSRKSSQELIKFYKGLDISYFDIENSNVRENDFDEEPTFQNCFNKLFKHNKHNISEDLEEYNNLLFISMCNQNINISSDNYTQDKMDTSDNGIEHCPSMSSLPIKKRKIFSINNGITQNKNSKKTNKRIRFVTYNYPNKT